jgi:hypothetical protein
MRPFSIVALLFVLSSSSWANSTVYDPFKALMLPRVAFTNASLSEVATTLEQEYSTHHQHGAPEAIRFVIHPSCSNIVVNVDLEHISVHGTLCLLSQMYDMEYSRTSNHILLARKGSTPMPVRIYDVLPTAFEEGTDVAQFFSQLGVEFPQEASAIYLKGMGKLIVHNSSINLDVLEKLLSVLNVVPYQIETTIQVIRPTDLELAAQTRKNETPTNIDSVVKNAESLLSWSTITSSGRKTTNSMDVHKPAAKGSGATVHSTKIMLSPSVDPSGGLLTMSVSALLDLSMGKNERLSYALDTSLTMYDGASLLLWFSPPVAAEGVAPMLCLVIGVRVIDPTGQVIGNRGSNIVERIMKQH